MGRGREDRRRAAAVSGGAARCRAPASCVHPAYPHPLHPRLGACSTLPAPPRPAHAATRATRPLLQAEDARLDAWRAERPEIKAFIASLAEGRAVIRKELARAEEVARAVTAAPVPVAGGATTGFNIIRWGLSLGRGGS